MVEGVKTFKAARTLLEKHGVKLRKLDFQVGDDPWAWEKRMAEGEQIWPVPKTIWQETKTLSFCVITQH